MPNRRLNGRQPAARPMSVTHPSSPTSIGSSGMSWASMRMIATTVSPTSAQNGQARSTRTWRRRWRRNIAGSSAGLSVPPQGVGTDDVRPSTSPRGGPDGMPRGRPRRAADMSSRPYPFEHRVVGDRLEGQLGRSGHPHLHPRVRTREVEIDLGQAPSHHLVVGHDAGHDRATL